MFETIEKNGIPFLHSSLLPFPHGFSTRAGGVSGEGAPHLASMNFGENRGDTQDNIRENFRRFTEATGLPYPAVAMAKQVHGSRIIEITDPSILPYGVLPEADGFFTMQPEVTLCVKIADCIPILLCSTDESRPAVCALHAGWRGSVAGIAQKGVKIMVDHGIAPKKIVAAIGVGIGHCCYEVGDDFIHAFRDALGNRIADRFLVRYGERFHADLKGLNFYLLKEAGVPAENIDICGECSCCAPDLYFSHRASHGIRGTMGAMIGLPMDTDNPISR